MWAAIAWLIAGALAAPLAWLVRQFHDAPLDTDQWQGGADETVGQAMERRAREAALVREIEDYLSHPSNGRD